MGSETTVRWNPRVEGLRGFSILLVFIFHLSNHGTHNWGALGVGLFFIISGYVITASMSRQLSLDSGSTFNISKFLLGFYVRRARRLLPLACLVISFSLAISFFDSTSDKKHYILSSIFCLLYVGNLFGFTFGYTDLAPALGHFWSLAVEEQFYILWPAIFYVAFKHYQKATSMAKQLILWIILIQISHPLIAFAGVTVWTLPSTYFDLLLLGCTLSLINVRIQGLRGGKLTAIQIAGISSLLFVLFGSKFSDSGILDNFQYNFNFLLTGFLFVFGLRSDFFNNSVFRFFGKISYSLYCIHWPLITFCKVFLGWNYLLIFSVAVISIVLSIFSHRYFESKFYKPLSTI